MFKRVTWFTIGAAAGTAGTIWSERKVRQQLAKAKPQALADSARDAVRAALKEGRAAAAAKEVELRDRYQSKA